MLQRISRQIRQIGPVKVITWKKISGYHENFFSGRHNNVYRLTFALRSASVSMFPHAVTGKNLKKSCIMLNLDVLPLYQLELNACTGKASPIPCQSERAISHVLSLVGSALQ